MSGPESVALVYISGGNGREGIPISGVYRNIDDAIRRAIVLARDWSEPVHVGVYTLAASTEVSPDDRQTL